MIKNKQFCISLLIPIVLGFCAFIAVVGIAPLMPTNLDLAQGVDPFKDYIAWVFYRHGPWTFPLGLNPSYGLDISSSVVFSDSIPLFAILFKAFSSILPEPFQYLGIWTLLCFILQSVFAWLLMGVFTSNRWLQFFGCVLLVFSPPMFWRVNQHAALVGHFLILASLYQILRVKTLWSSRQNLLSWGLILGAAVLVHFSLFVMVAFLWGASLADQFKNRSDIALGVKIKEALVQTLVIGGLILFLMWQAGYFAMSAASGALGGYGFFRMNLLSPLDAKGWSYLLKPLRLPSDYGEGYMYLGLGFLLLWPFALFKLGKSFPAIKHFFMEHAILFVALFALSLFAITNHIAFGRYEFSFAISDPIYQIASIFRASGRFFWPMFYCLALGCIWLIIRNYSQRNAIILLALAAATQMIDTRAGWQKLRLHLADPKVNIPHELGLKSPFWAEVSRQYDNILLMPPQDKGAGWEQVAMLAAKYHLGTNAVFFARADASKVALSHQQFINDLNQGKWNPKNLYVLQSDLVLPAYFHSNPQTDLLANIDGMTILAPNWKACANCTQIDENVRSHLDKAIQSIEVNKPILFGKAQNGSEFLVGVGGSWAWPEAWGVWSNGSEAKLILPLPEKGKPKHLMLDLRAFVSAAHPRQNIEIMIQGMPPQAASLVQFEKNQIELNLPPLIKGEKYIEIIFILKNPASPKDVGGNSSDDRRLGIGLVSASFLN